MAFWLMFWFWLGSTLLQVYLARKKIEDSKPSGLGDFQVPTATEGRVVPVFVGKVRLNGPNVIWYGDLKPVPIIKKSGGFLGIGAKKQTVGFKYHMGVQLGMSRGPIDGVSRVWFGDKPIYSGPETATSFLVDLPDLLGGPEKGGGIKIHFGLHLGTTSQTANTYLAAFQSPALAYPHTFHIVLTDGSGGPAYIGESAQLRSINVEAFWYPNSLAVTGGKHRIGDDANPICFLFEILSANTDWGIQFPTDDVLITGTAAQGALRAVAEQCADEGLGFSMVIDREMPLNELVSEIERHVDGAFRLDLTDGKYKILLARPVVGVVPIVDETNSRTLSFSRGNWADTRNELRVSYSDRAKEYQSTFAMDFDLGNREIVGSRSIQTSNYPGVKNAPLANLIAARELLGLSYPLARASLALNRELFALQRGSVFDWSDPDEGIASMRLRVTKIRYGTDVDREITVDVVEDIYRLETTGFVAPPPTQWVQPSTTALAALDARIWEPAAQLSMAEYQPVMLVARNGGQHQLFDVYLDKDGSFGGLTFGLTNPSLSDWTPAALLAEALGTDLEGPPHYQDSVLIDNLVDISAAEFILVANSTINSDEPLNILLVDDELMYWTAAVDNGNGSVTLTLQRGVLGTIPKAHSDNARVWFPAYGAGLLTENFNVAFGLGTSFRARIGTRTATGALAIGSAPNIPSAADYTRTGLLPYAPNNVAVSSRLFVDEDWPKTPGHLRLTWNQRNHLTQAFGTRQDDASVSPPAGTTYDVRVKRVDNSTAVHSNAAVTGAAYNVLGFIAQSPTGVPAELDYFIEVFTLLGGVTSQTWRSPNFEVIGFGIDFGGDFGGQQLSSDPNLGTVLRNF
jgi:hypothetical protein